jgi:proteasome lid subunit RPN8/RPN11
LSGPDARPLGQAIASRDGRLAVAGWRVHAAGALMVDARVAQRFNAYAALAYPFEVGGLLRLIADDAGGWRVIDLCVLEQEANEASFELDPVAVARHAQALEASGRGGELREWRGMVHSHPSMQAFMSSVDQRTLVALAGDGFAFSLICCAHPNPRRNSWAAFYAQRKPLPLVTDLPVGARGGSLSGIELLDSVEHERIARELVRLLHRPPAVARRARSLARAGPGERMPTPAMRRSGGLDPDCLTASELALAVAVLEQRREHATATGVAASLETLGRLAGRLQSCHRLTAADAELLATEVKTARRSGLEWLSRSLLAKLDQAQTTQGGNPTSIRGCAPEVRVDYRRQSALVDPELAAALHVTVCGAGTVGSHAALELCRMGIGEFTIYDDDIVAPENLPSQTYQLADVGEAKVAALAELLRASSDHVRVHAYASRLAGGEPLPGRVVVLAVDSMLMRKVILERSLAHRPNHELVLDVRVGSTLLQIVALDPCSTRELARWREEYWFADEQAEQLPCGTSAASFVGALAGALIASYVRLHLLGERPPFFVQHDLNAHAQLVCVPASSRADDA